MLGRLDPYSLQLFMAAADAGSLGRAAANESIAASALSRRIADLEHVFGLPLFVRSPHGIALTDAGRVAYDRLKGLQGELESLLGDVRSLTGVISGRVRLFANASAVIGFLPERLKPFTAAYPQVSLELQERLSKDIVRACLDELADVGICIIDDTPAGIDAWPFASDPLMVVLPQGHPLGAEQALSLRQVAEHSLVGIQLGGSLDRSLRDRAEAAGLGLKVAVSVNSFDGVCRMVEAGLGIAVVPASAATAYAGSSQFVRKPLDEAWGGRALRLIAPRKLPRPPAVEALIQALKG